MLRPVERSMTVSAPQRIAQTIFSTSSAAVETTAELPMLALILTRKLRPIAIGSSSGWLMLAGMMARPRATSSRTNSGVMKSRDRGAEALAVGEPLLAPRAQRLRAAEVLAVGDVDHLLGDDPGAGELVLRHQLAGLAACGSSRSAGQAGTSLSAGDVAVVLGLDRARPRPPRSRALAIQRLAHAAAGPASRSMRGVRLGVGAGRVVDAHRRLVRIGERDLAEGHADVGAAAGAA